MSTKGLVLNDKHVHTMHRAMKTDSALQEKNKVPPLRKFHQTEQIQTHTHPHTHSGAVAQA